MTKTFHSQYADNHQESTGLLFARVYNAWHGRVKKALQKVGLTHPQFIILTSLGYLELQQDLVTQVNLAAFSDMDVMTVSQVLKLLLKKGLVERREHPQDSRAKVVFLTDIGRERMNQALPLVEAIDQTYFGQLGIQVSDFNRLLLKLEENDG
ncbi:Transcriptional regulator HosA [Streptococcus sp. BCA20]|jgi:putative transcriptional regulator|uniref:Transcriptional regulator n=2 Tax=Streptococcus intermedius TaxID=1338 RepID=A0AAE8G2G3_STRIT|nr:MULTISPECIES: MarR family winged helix-turn-helix transcriptional regulator [Streptococcus]RSJ34417.1 Transcriptional regulator HosA [Streptococcus sp. BCA20]AGU76756.1 putative transcriptional regulator [Streptococcus intermedius B196]EKU17639.1 marR family protein [Streptococcus intermedius BA1]MCI3916922.1 MarR family winged helix-turn-helix transcriptional regulator [Streptococcus intermedius]MDK8091040.1 MarR family winged helix-turn-helix transcriptional regulator [Streptococcus inter